MLFAVFAAYLLLALPVRGGVTVVFRGLSGSVTLKLHAGGLRFSREKKIMLRGTGEKAGKPIYQALRSGAKFEKIEAYARVGLADAMQTALAAGSARAFLLGVISCFPRAKETHVCVLPQFAGQGFFLRVRCIFSFSPGDIMLAAARAAGKTKRKEGMQCRSIPSRA